MSKEMMCDTFQVITPIDPETGPAETSRHNYQEHAHADSIFLDGSYEDQPLNSERQHHAATYGKPMN